MRQSLDLCHIHSHILAQPNVAANNAKLFVITKSQQHFYTRLSHCHKFLFHNHSKRIEHK